MTEDRSGKDLEAAIERLRAALYPGTCRRGHERNEQNTRILVRDNRIERECRICRRGNITGNYDLPEVE